MQIRRRMCDVLLLVVGACVAATAAQSPTSAPAPINTMCPVLTDEPVDPAYTTTYQGHVIGFCCEKCLTKFTANPGRYVARLAGLSDHEPMAPSARMGPPVAPNGEHAEEHEHEHEHDAEHEEQRPKGFVARLIAWLGKFHPAAVNFPIAMIVGAALAEVLLMRTGKAPFANAGRFCLWVGALGAIGAGALGWCLGGFHFVDELWLVTTHRWLGTTTAAWSLLTLAIGESTMRQAPPVRTRYRVVLFVAVMLVGVTGFFGGSLIYGLDHYAW